MQSGAIDIHHHLRSRGGDRGGEAERQSPGHRGLEDKTERSGFRQRRSKISVGWQGLTDWCPARELMRKAKSAGGGLIRARNCSATISRANKAESWCRIYNESLKNFWKKYPERFTAMAAVPIQEPARAAKVLEHAVIQLGFRGAYIATQCNHNTMTVKISIRSGLKAEELDVSSSSPEIGGN